MNRVSKCHKAEIANTGLMNVGYTPICTACGKPCSVVETGGDKDISFNCLNDCKNLIPSGGNFDNPDIGGCAVEYKFQPNTTLEHDSKLHTCPYYSVTLPAALLTDEKERVANFLRQFAKTTHIELLDDAPEIFYNEKQVEHIAEKIVKYLYPLAFAAGYQKAKEELGK